MRPIPSIGDGDVADRHWGDYFYELHRSSIIDVDDDVNDEFIDACSALQRDWKGLRQIIRNVIRHEYNDSQLLAAALGFPLISDDQKIFPGTTPADGYMTFHYTLSDLIDLAVEKIKTLDAQVAIYQSGNPTPMSGPEITQAASPTVRTPPQHLSSFQHDPPSPQH